MYMYAKTLNIHEGSLVTMNAVQLTSVYINVVLNFLLKFVYVCASTKPEQTDKERIDFRYKHVPVRRFAGQFTPYWDFLRFFPFSSIEVEVKSRSFIFFKFSSFLYDFRSR